MTEERKQELIALQLSVDEIKFLAKQNGFHLATIQPRIKVSPCICGNTTRKWYDPVSCWTHMHTNMKQFKCGKCDFEGGWAKTEKQAKKLWNEAVAEAIAERDKEKGDR